MIRVCPTPPIWVDIYQSLESEWKRLGQGGDAPPIPLVLAGWIYSSDRDKQERWNLTIEWARHHNMEHLIPDLADDQFYRTHFLTTSYPEQHYGPQNHPPAERPSEDTLSRALIQLQENWTSIAGETLFELTSPLEFTGDKARRLRVAVVRPGNPPWGHWESFAVGSDRRSFTAFRQRVNEAISPLHVDHIDFKYRI